MEVKIEAGSIKGQEKTSILGQQYFAFQGIPYAQPPTGQLRFAAPQPVISWEGTLDCLKEGNMCMQRHLFLREYQGDEDCLYLNVFTLQTPPCQLKPVMVWVHGGGFTGGSGDGELYAPDFLLKHDVVIVTFNYRLGVLGFLSTGDGAASGNWGLKDQVAALHWVQDNIYNFGGDPGNVTLFGNSAGAASIQYHMISHMSKGLFKRCILQSGSCLNPWALMTAPTTRERALTLGAAFGIVTTDTSQLLDKLRQIPTLDLLKNQNKVLTPIDMLQGLVFPFVPCVEVGGRTADMFLLEHPAQLLTKPSQYPAIIGLNSNEAFLLLKDIDLDGEYLATQDTELAFIPSDLPCSTQLANKIKQLYFKDRPVGRSTLSNYLQKFGLFPNPISYEDFSDPSRSSEKIQDLKRSATAGGFNERDLLKWAHVKLKSDILFSIGINRSIDLCLRNNSEPLYCYQFDFSGRLSHIKNLVLLTNKPEISLEIPGACHADEVGYLFYSNMAGLPNMEPDSAEMKTVHRLTSMWTNFAKTGSPNGSTLETHWPAARPGNFAHLHISCEMSVKTTEFFPMRDSFWLDIYRQLGNDKNEVNAKL